VEAEAAASSSNTESFYPKNEFEVNEFFNIDSKRSTFDLPSAIQLLRSPDNIEDLNTRNKVKIIRLVKSGKDMIDEGLEKKDPNILNKATGYWDVILELNRALDAILPITDVEKNKLEEMHKEREISTGKIDPIEYVGLLNQWLNDISKRILKQKLEYAFFLNPRIKKMKFENMNDLVIKINSTIQESKGIYGGKRTRRRKLFRHKTRHTVNRL
jgi:hypothetical protein